MQLGLGPEHDLITSMSKGRVTECEEPLKEVASVTGSLLLWHQVEQVWRIQAMQGSLPEGRQMVSVLCRRRAWALRQRWRR